MAFAGFSPGEAEGLRRAMSRKRSAAAIEAYHQRFVDGAMARFDDVDEALAERVYTMIVGFSGFGFPKAHGAAFGLLAYQSTWLRVHYAPEFLARCSTSSRWASTHPTRSSTRPSAAGSRSCPRTSTRARSGARSPRTAPCASASATSWGCAPRRSRGSSPPGRRVARSPRSTTSSPGPGPGRPALERLAWSGACDALAATAGAPARSARRVALWRLGTAATAYGMAGGARQLALPLELPDAPGLAPLGAWQAMIADYATTGVATQEHPLALLRDGLAERGTVSSADLGSLEHGTRVRIGGLVVARQRPGDRQGGRLHAARGRGGTVNLVVPPAIYERDRLAVRTEPLVLAEGTLERFAAGGGAVNVLVRRVVALEAPAEELRPAAEVKDFSPLDDRELERASAERELAMAAGGSGGEHARADDEASDFRAVAPPVMNFAQGRRR